MSDLELYLTLGAGALTAIAGAAAYAYKKRTEKRPRHQPPEGPPSS